MHRALESVEAVEHDRAGQLARAVRAEVEEDDRITVTEDANRLPLRIDDDARLDELVGDVRGVRSFDQVFRRLRFRVCLALSDRVVGALGAIPALVAVHGVVAATHRADPSDARLGEGLLELADVTRPSGRGSITPVRDDVHEETRAPLLSCQLN